MGVEDGRVFYLPTDARRYVKTLPLDKEWQSITAGVCFSGGRK
jgi:hypothetical protein